MMTSNREKPSKPDNIPLYDLAGYEIRYEFHTPYHSKEIVYDITFYFCSYLGAGMFYQQFQEKFIPQKTKNMTPKYKPTFFVKEPVQQHSSYKHSEHIKDKKWWAVECSYTLNKENQYGQIIQSIQNSSMKSNTYKVNFFMVLKEEIKKLSQDQQSHFNFVEHINSYFDFPNVNHVKLDLNKIEFNHDVKETAHSSITKIVYTNEQFFIPTNTYAPTIKSMLPKPNPSQYQAEVKKTNNIYCDPKLPMEQIPWPHHRRYNPDYITLLTQQDEITLATNSRVNDFVTELPPKPIIIEFGAGAGYGASDIKKLIPEAKIIPVGITPLYPENISYCDEIYYTSIPSNLALLKDYFGMADRVIDVFGAGTYAANAIHVTIYAACLLKKGGRFMSVISGLDDSPYTFDSCPLGSGINRHKLVAFFKEHLGINVEIKKTQVASRLKPGKNVEDFYFEFTRDENAKPLTYNDFLPLCQRADEVLGIPHEIDVSTDSRYGQFKTQSIKSVLFFNPNPEREKEDVPSFTYTA